MADIYDPKNPQNPTPYVRHRRSDRHRGASQGETPVTPESAQIPAQPETPVPEVFAAESDAVSEPTRKMPPVGAGRTY